MSTISNRDFIARISHNIKEDVKKSDLRMAFYGRGVHDAHLLQPLLIELDRKGISIDSRLPPVTRRGKIGIGRISTLMTEASDELKLRHGDNSVFWTQSEFPQYRNKRYIRHEYVNEYVEIMAQKLGL